MEPTNNIRCDETHPPVNSTYIVHETLRNHTLPKTLWLSGKLTIDQVKYALLVLKRNGIIKKSGRAWVVIKDTIPDTLGVKNTHRVGMRHTPPSHLTSMAGKVRGHGFQFTLRLPKIEGWDRRESVLIKKGIPYKSLASQKAQCISMAGINKIWLCEGSIVFYLGKTSFFSDKAESAGISALDFTLKAIRKLENELGIGSERLKTGQGYKIKVSRSHYALIHNELAKHYDKPRRKLQVYDENGLWFLIDNSFNLHEAEFVRPNTNVEEADFHKMFLNDLNKTRLTPSATLAAIKRVEEKTMPIEITARIENMEKSMLGFMPVQMAQSNTLNMQTLILQDMSKLVKAALLNKEGLSVVKVEITEDVNFTGLEPYTYETHDYDLKKGTPIVLERDTANALIMNRKAKIV